MNKAIQISGSHNQTAQQDTYGRRDFFSIGLVGVSALVLSATLDPSVAKATTGQQGFNLMFNSSFKKFSPTGVAGWTIS